MENVPEHRFHLGDAVFTKVDKFKRCVPVHLRRAYEMAAVIEVEGFQLQDGTYVIKELAYSVLQTGELFHGLYKPPTEFENLTPRDRHQCTYVSNNIHGLRWEEGELPYEKLEEHLRRVACFVLYAKGFGKCKMLEKQYGIMAYNLDSVLCPTMTELPEVEVRCTYHSRKKHCAMAKAVAFASWLKE